MEVAASAEGRGAAPWSRPRTGGGEPAACPQATHCIAHHARPPTPHTWGAPSHTSGRWPRDAWAKCVGTRPAWLTLAGAPGSAHPPHETSKRTSGPHPASDPTCDAFATHITHARPTPGRRGSMGTRAGCQPGSHSHGRTAQPIHPSECIAHHARPPHTWGAPSHTWALASSSCSSSSRRRSMEGAVRPRPPCRRSRCSSCRRHGTWRVLHAWPHFGLMRPRTQDPPYP